MKCYRFVLRAGIVWFALFLLDLAQFPFTAAQALESPAAESWTTTTPLPEAFGHTPAVVYNGRLYLVGGDGPVGGNPRTTVYYAAILSDGAVGAWNTTTPLPKSRDYHALVEANGYLYAMGGYSTEGLLTQNTIHYAPLNADGTLGSWKAASLPVELGNPMTVFTGGRLYVLGGHNGSITQKNVYYTTISSDGSVTGWSATTELAEGVGWSGAVEANGRIYVAGGANDSGRTAAAYSALINADGTLGSWSSLTALPKAIANHVLLRNGNKLYVAGGWDGTASQKKVYFATIRSNGTLSSWTAMTDLPQTLHDLAGASYENKLYLLAGFNHGVPAYQNTVYFTQFAFSCSNVNEIPSAECAALVALYNSTNGANWSNRTGWLTTYTPCSWYGVTCANNHVIRLTLVGNQLSGSIPPQSGDLTSLQTLDLSFNQLNGTIPVELGNLANVQTLFLHVNQLSGSIPAQLGNLTQLDHLDLSDNQLSGSIPAEMGNLAQLRHLDLYNNRLSGSIPAQLGNLTNLQIVELPYNQLSGSIPAQLGNLSKLTALILGNNQLSSKLPPELSNLSNLTDLSLDNNQFSGALPANFINLTQLARFSFNNTGLCEPSDAAFQAWLTRIPNLNRTGTPCPPDPTVQFSPATYAADESVGLLNLTVALNTTADQTVSVEYSVSGGSATRDSDYQLTNGTLVFSPGEVIKRFTLGLVDDAADEADEIVNLALSNPTNAKLGAQATAVLTIVDNDNPPTAAFRADPLAGGRPLIVHFFDQSSDKITSWSWNFGDGTTSNAQNPDHTYATAGDFTVALTVGNLYGTNTATRLAYIQVSESFQAPQANFSASPGSGNVPLTVNFADTSTGVVSSRSWNFGDGGISDLQNISHTYTVVGNYTVSLTVGGPGGSNTKTLANYIQVLDSRPAIPELNAIPNPDSDGDFIVSWQSSANAGLYDLQEQFNDGNWNTIYLGPATSQTVTGKSAGMWCYHVRAANSVDNSAWSSSHCVRVDEATPMPASAPIYLALVSNLPASAPTPTPTPTATPPAQPIWQRIGQAGLQVSSLAVQNDQLFVGDRREFDQGGGLYQRTLSSCSATPDLVHSNAIDATVLGVALQGTQGAVAAFGGKIYYTNDSGNAWQKTASQVGRPRTIVIVGANTFYAGAESEGIYRSDNGGATWEQQTTNPQAINRIKLDLLDANSLWIATEDNGVWKLTVGINRLIQKSVGLSGPALKVWDFAFDAAGNIYLATYDGVYRGDGAGGWQPFGLQGKELLSLAIVGDQLYSGARDRDNGGNEAGVWRRPLDGGDWQSVTAPGWDNTYTVRDLLYDAGLCQGLLAATDDGVWIYR